MQLLPNKELEELQEFLDAILYVACLSCASPNSCQMQENVSPCFSCLVT